MLRPIVFSLLAAIPTAVSAQDGPALFTQEPSVAESIVRPEKGKPVERPKRSAAQELLAGGPKATWIWDAPNAKGEERCVFRKEFDGDAQSAALVASCDNEMTIWLNGKRVAASSEWQQPTRKEITALLKPGQNLLEIEAANHGGIAAFVLKLALKRADGKVDYIVTGADWKAAKTRDADEWLAVHTLGKLGVSPWGDVFSKPQGLVSSVPRDVFVTLPGYRVERLYTVPKETQGSWVSIAFDDKGRLIASDQGDKGLYRITPPPIGSDKPTSVEKLNVKMTSSHGMLYAFDSLYVSVNGGPGSGLYRLRDTDGDDQFDEVKQLKALQGGGEHGPHSLRLSPDGKSIYLIAGNHTNVPKDFDSSLIPSNWSEDLLLPRQWDARGHARGKLAPGGWIARTDPDGRHWEIVSMGYRNPFDFDFNADGEIFAYDADMEWDLGSPWYRPTRVVHATSGSEFGWRSGTGKWPTYYADSLPATVDIGPGSPVGVTFGTGAKFPARYQKALFILDWTFGTIYAVHTKAAGASYTAEKEEFLSRTPLPLTDAAVGPDGALYFSVGGRNTQSELFRVTYVGEEATGAVDARDRKFTSLRGRRQELEGFHGRRDPSAIDELWSDLGHADRHIRYAARIALEAQETRLWQERVLTEKNPRSLITAVIALARQGDKALQARMLSALEGVDVESLGETGQLELLRAYALTFVRMGRPDQAAIDRIAARLEPFYPAATNNLNRELSRVLVYLNSSSVVEKTLELMSGEEKQDGFATTDLLARNSGYGGTIANMLANQPNLQATHYAFVLRNVRFGWTLEQRKEYFKWFEGALKRSGGASYEGFIRNIHSEAMANVSDAEKAALATTELPAAVDLSKLPKAKGPGRKWTLNEVVALADDGLRGRSFQNGRVMYQAARCGACHRFAGEGGATGPDLTNLAGRFSLRDLSESLIEPSKVISDQYRAMDIQTISGKVVSGRVASEADGTLTVLTDPFDASKTVEIRKSDVEEQQPAKVSLMPEGLLDTLNREEVLDLLAYLISRGNPEDRMFAE